MRTWKRSHFDLERNSGHAFVRIVAGHLHVAAERQRTDAVLGLASLHTENGRIEAELKLQDPDADALGGQKVPELVHEDEDTEDEGKREQRDQCSGH